MAHTVQTTRAWSTRQAPQEVVSTVSAPSRLDLQTSADPDAVGDGRHWTPIELLAAALSGCLLHAALDVARRSKVDLRQWRDRVTLTLDRRDGPGVRVVAASVEVEVGVARDTRPGRAERIVHKAHGLCTVAQSLAAPVTLTVRVARNFEDA